MASAYDIKIIRDAEIEDLELPVLPNYKDIQLAPRSLEDLDADAAQELEDAFTAIDGLGDLAYEDLVTELQLADDAVTNAKIAVDAIQGDVIAAGAITGVKISDNAVTAAKIEAGAVTAGKIAANAIVANNIQAGEITSSKLSSGAVVAGKIAAGAIDGITITGSLVRTSSGSTRVQMNDSSNSFDIYQSSTLRARGTATGWSYFNPSGSSVADFYADTTTYGSRSLLISVSGSSTGSIYNATGSSGTFAIYNGSQVAAYWQQFEMITAYGIQPLSSDLFLGGDPYAWNSIYLNSVGYVDSDGDEGNPFPPNSGWSVSKLGTGRYRVFHPYNTIFYTVVITPVASTVKMATVSDRDSDYFDVRISNLDFALEDNDFMFQIILQ